jgi:hypothetical protein
LRKRETVGDEYYCMSSNCVGYTRVQAGQMDRVHGTWYFPRVTALLYWAVFRNKKYLS